MAIMGTDFAVGLHSAGNPELGGPAAPRIPLLDSSAGCTCVLVDLCSILRWNLEVCPFRNTLQTVGGYG